ncbi:hypothetical protein AB4Y96_26375, partial [Phyllobacterium sp. TAF24]|uniref:hypothetical protein n=1 Tax=Phyllobacterium sp. TAF24 TaxID=3233068 RepID=UPI003F999B3A
QVLQWWRLVLQPNQTPHPELVEGRNNRFAADMIELPHHHTRFRVWLLKGGKDGRSKGERGCLGIGSVINAFPGDFPV